MMWLNTQNEHRMVPGRSTLAVYIEEPSNALRMFLYSQILFILIRLVGVCVCLFISLNYMYMRFP